MRILRFGLSIAALLALSPQAQALDDEGVSPSGTELQTAAREQQRLAQFAEAAVSFEQAAARLPESDPESLSALRSAVALRIRLGQPDQARRVAAIFATRARHRPELAEEAAGLARAIAGLYEERGDDGFEQALRLLDPSTLRRGPVTKGPPRVAPKQLGAFTQAGFNAVRETENAYQAVFALPVTPSQIAANGRIGQLPQTFVESLTALPLPPLSMGPPPSGVDPAKWERTLREAYCATLSDNSEPLRERATAAFVACDADSVEQGRFGEWPTLCEQTLSRVRPSAHPRRTDIHLAPIHSPYLLDAAPVFGQLGR